MKETPQQYLARILSYVETQDPIKLQTIAPKRFEKLVAGLPAAEWKRVPGPGKWTIGEIMAHVAEMEVVYGFRIRQILSSTGTTLQVINQDAWAKSGKYAQRDPVESAAAFAGLREANLSLLRQLDPAQWEQFGVHPERGPETVRKIVEMFAGHDVNHIRQIENILAESRAAQKAKKSPKRGKSRKARKPKARAKSKSRSKSKKRKRR